MRACWVGHGARLSAPCALGGLVALATILAAGAVASSPSSSTEAIRQYRAAVALHNRGVYDLAADEWKKFLDEYSQDPLAAKAEHYLGICHLQSREFAQAERALSRASETSADDKLLPTTLINLGLAQFNLGRAKDPAALERAVATFERLIETFEAHEYVPTARFYLAEARYAQGHVAESVDAYEAFLNAHAGHRLEPKALYGLGIAQQETDDFVGAVKTHEKFLQKFSAHPLALEVTMRLGDALLRSGQAEQALPRFAAAAGKADFEFADYALMREAQCRMELRQYAAAAERYQKILTDYPQSQYGPLAELGGGKCLFLAGSVEKAIGLLERANQREDDSRFQAAHWLARCHLQQQAAETALEVVRRTLEDAAENPLRTDLLIDKADALYTIEQRREEAIDIYRDTAREQPQHPRAPYAQYMAAYASLETGRIDQARGLAERFLSDFPSDPLAADVKVVVGECLLHQKKYAEAEQLFATLVRDFPDRSEVDTWRVRHGTALFMQEKYQQTIDLLKPSIEQMAHEEVAPALQLIGDSHLELRRYAAAVPVFQAGLDAAGKETRRDKLLLGLALAQHGAGNPSEAEATLGRLLSDHADSTLVDRALFRLAEWKSAAGTYAEAEKAYQQLLERFPRSDLVPHALFGLGWAQLSRDEHGQAATTLTRLIDAFPDHALASRSRYARAVCLLETEKAGQALADIDAFLQETRSREETSDARYVRGLALGKLRRHAAVLETLQTLLRDDPEYAGADRALYEIAWAHQELGQQTEATQAFARLAEQFPQSSLAAESMLRVGEMRYAERQFAEAEDYFRRAMEKNDKAPIGERAAHKLAWCSFEQKKYEQALSAFDKQISRYPEGSLLADALVMQGECLFQQEQYQQARAAFDAGLAKEPAGDSLRQVALLHSAQAASEMKDWQQSLELLDRFSERFPESPYDEQVQFEVAWAKQHLDKLDEALRLYEALAERNEGELGARSRFMIGEIQFQRESYRDAVRTFFKVAYGYGGADAPDALKTWQANAMFEAARCLEQLQKPEPAMKMYAELIEVFPESAKARMAEKKLAALRQQR